MQTIKTNKVAGAQHFQLGKDFAIGNIVFARKALLTCNGSVSAQYDSIQGRERRSPASPQVGVVEEDREEEGASKNELLLSSKITRPKKGPRQADISSSGL